MTDEERDASARRAREARGKRPEQPKRYPALKAGAPLERPLRNRGVIGVRKLAVGVLQQQLEALRDRVLTLPERQFLLEACRVLVSGEKVVKAPNNAAAPRTNGGDSQGAPLPPLSTNGAGK